MRQIKIALLASYNYLRTKSSNMLNKNSLAIKKVQGHNQKQHCKCSQATKTLIPSLFIKVAK